ncbi:MAG TPA: HRDC domain-containing protein, partial [Gemmatimonadaceae bacterium]|nr:HRDC domain-containing protein [Gemmatimonadaceae bacterium]
LADPRGPLSRFQIDWEGLDRRRRTELSKLEAVQRYAYTTGCRRAFVLRYFGDAAASAACSGCDNCLGLHKGIERDPPGPPGRGTGAGGRRRSTSSPGGSGRRSSVPAAAPAADPVVGPDDAPLFSALRALRSELARAEQVPAYVVFPDRALAEMAVRRPRTLAALGEVRGVGPARLEKYGARFLDAIRSAADTEAA